MADRALKSVLVLEDCPDLLDLYIVLVEKRCGGRAVAAKSLAEIQGRSKEALNCQLAFLDINLGPNNPNGVDAYRWLRSNGFSGPIYFVTGHAESFGFVSEAEQLGDAKVLNKPVHTQELIEIIQRGENGLHF